MVTLREQYHHVGNKVNTALMGIGIAKKYIEELETSPGNLENIKNSIESCAVVERALLELDESLNRLKSIAYRFTDPDGRQDDREADIRKENSAISVLIVDDEPDVCALVKQLYEKRGYSVRSALGGQEALARINESEPDIVLLDLHLHDCIEGIDVLRFIKSEKPAIKCIVITREDDALRLKEIAELKPEDILIKPVLATQLDAKVSGLIAGLGK
ncbi:MAG: response regulator [Candidatus Omnitrophica bacterium]|nr:response regulator [Candidatus Omnitrophota bacterium]